MSEIDISPISVSFRVDDPQAHDEVCRAVGERVKALLAFILSCHCNRENEPVTLRGFIREIQDELEKLDVTGNAWTCAVDVIVQTTHPLLMAFVFKRRGDRRSMCCFYGNTEVRIGVSTFEETLNLFYDKALWKILPARPWVRIRDAYVASRDGLHISFIPPASEKKTPIKQEPQEVISSFTALWENPARLFDPEHWKEGELDQIFACNPNFTFTLLGEDDKEWFLKWPHRDRSPTRWVHICFQNKMLFVHTHQQPVYAHFGEMFRLRIEDIFGSDLGLILEACLTTPIDFEPNDVDWENDAPKGITKTEYHSYIPHTPSEFIVCEKVDTCVSEKTKVILGRYHYLLRDGRQLCVICTGDVA